MWFQKVQNSVAVSLLSWLHFSCLLLFPGGSVDHQVKDSNLHVCRQVIQCPFVGLQLRPTMSSESRKKSKTETCFIPAELEENVWFRIDFTVEVHVRIAFSVNIHIETARFSVLVICGDDQFQSNAWWVCLSAAFGVSHSTASFCCDTDGRNSGLWNFAFERINWIFVVWNLKQCICKMCIVLSNKVLNFIRDFVFPCEFKAIRIHRQHHFSFLKYVFSDTCTSPSAPAFISNPS